MPLQASDQRAAFALATSLFALNGEEKHGIFRYRTHSPYWAHSVDDEKCYQASDQKRTASQCACLWLWGHLRADPKFDKQYQLMSTTFVAMFWHVHKRVWRTTEGEESYHRAVDSALCLLTLLRMRKVAKAGDAIGAEGISALIQQTRDALITSFGWSPPFTNAQSYIGKQSASVLWQDLWVLVALVLSDAPANRADRRAMWAAIQQKYKRSDLAHVPCSGGSGSVTYVNDVFFYLLCTRLMHKTDPEHHPAACVQVVETACLAYLSTCCTVPLSELSTPFLFFERQGHTKTALHPATEAIFFLLFDLNDFVSA